MRVSKFFVCLSLLATSALAACGTITQGGTQTVDVVVKGSPSAYCDISTSVYRNAGTFPNKVTLERSYEPLTLDCRGEQNLTKKFTIKPTQNAEATVGNLPNGLLAGLGYDIASGGAWSYPDPLIVDFRQADEVGATPDWPKTTVDDAIDPTRVGTADIEKPQPIHMQPVMDGDLDPSLPSRAVARPQAIDATQIAIQHQAENNTASYQDMPKGTQMQPVISPEDDPAVLAAKKAEAAKKAKAAAKKKIEAEKAKAKKAAAAKAKKEAAKKAKAEADAAKPADTATTATPADTTAQPAEPAPANTAAPTDTTQPAEPMPAPVTDKPVAKTESTPAPAAATEPAKSETPKQPVIENPPAIENPAPKAEEKKTEATPTPATQEGPEKYIAGSAQ